MTTTPAREADIIIVGAGLTGLTAALTLKRDCPALSLVVIDRATQPPPADDDFGLRVSALTPASVRLFESLGVWHDMADSHHRAFTSMRVWDAATACGEGIHFSAEGLAVDALGVITDNAMLRRCLYASLAELEGVSLIDASVDAVISAPDSLVVSTSTGERWKARLLIGADGRDSIVRRLTGMPVKGWSHQQRAVVANLDCELANQSCALQRFMPDGPLALLPLTGGSVSLVWTTTPAHADALLTLDDTAFNAAVTEASDHVLGALSLRSKRAAFPLISQFATDPVAARSVVIGDAAHAIHPLAGQGANLGFADAATIAEIIAEAFAAGADPGDAPWLRRYRRRRQGDNLLTLYGLDFLNRLFAREHGVLADLRRRGMRWFSANPLAKRLAGGHAMGSSLGILPPRGGI